MRLRVRVVSTIVLSGLSVLVSCASAPIVDTLPPPQPVDLAIAALPAAELPVTALEVEGVDGGEIAARIDGSVEDLLAMLLDFENSDGHRAWAAHFELLTKTADRVEARWDFRGRAGIRPSLPIAFDISRRGGEVVIDYRQLESVFGLAAFFGDYRLRPIPGESGAILIERVFIASGLPFVGASAADIADGLRKDVERLREWRRERLGDGSPAHHP